MPVSAAFRQRVQELLAELAPRVTQRNMFGGVGIYASGKFFALLAENVLYLKASDDTRADFEAAGLSPFRPYGDQRMTMKYYGIPQAWLTPAKLGPWVKKALAAAVLSPKRKPATKKPVATNARRRC